MDPAAVIEKRGGRWLGLRPFAEATAQELVRQLEARERRDHAASMHRELAPLFDPERLVAETARSPIVWMQRLEYLLDLTHQGALANVLVTHVSYG